MSSRVEDYGLIGDCETAALVSKGGSIDWLCWPRFDSGACFSALLGDTNHGRWSIAPAAVASDIKVSRRYAHNTLILETEFISADGKNAVVLVDFMPLREGRNSSHLVRLVVGKRGSMAMRTEWIVRFGYGAGCRGYRAAARAISSRSRAWIWSSCAPRSSFAARG
jgi:GH15 family glucan-1,4-alpha-glucosidase